MRLQFPVLKPLKCIQESVSSLDYKLSVPQSRNLMLVLTAIFVCNSLSLVKMSLALLGKKSVSTLSHFFSYARLNAQELLASAVRWAIRHMNLSGVSVRIAIDDTMKHHSRGAKKIANVHWLFDHVTQSYCNASCIVFAYVIIGECLRFPIRWRVYEKGGKSKWKLAIELIDDVLAMDLKIGVVLFTLKNKKMVMMTLTYTESSTTLGFQMPISLITHVYL